MTSWMENSNDTIDICINNATLNGCSSLCFPVMSAGAKIGHRAPLERRFAAE
jgi:hypothetical protein